MPAPPVPMMQAVRWPASGVGAQVQAGAGHGLVGGGQAELSERIQQRQSVLAQPGFGVEPAHLTDHGNALRRFRQILRRFKAGAAVQKGMAEAGHVQTDGGNNAHARDGDARHRDPPARGRDQPMETKSLILRFKLGRDGIHDIAKSFELGIEGIGIVRHLDIKLFLHGENDFDEIKRGYFKILNPGIPPSLSRVKGVFSTMMSRIFSSRSLMCFYRRPESL